MWPSIDIYPGLHTKAHATLDSLSFYSQVLVTNFEMCNKPPDPCLPTATHLPFSLLFSTVLALSYSLSASSPFFSCVPSPGHDQSTSVSALDSSRHLRLFSLIATVKAITTPWRNHVSSFFTVPFTYTTDPTFNTNILLIPHCYSDPQADSSGHLFLSYI